jgi:hypothetical protein
LGLLQRVTLQKAGTILIADPSFRPGKLAGRSKSILARIAGHSATFPEVSFLDH